MLKKRTLSWYLKGSSSVIWNMYSVKHFLTSYLLGQMCVCTCMHTVCAKAADCVSVGGYLCVGGGWCVGDSECLWRPVCVCEREPACMGRPSVCSTAGCAEGQNLCTRVSTGVCAWVEKWWAKRNTCWQILKIVSRQLGTAEMKAVDRGLGRMLCEHF